jgi:hypothetical protein
MPDIAPEVSLLIDRIDQEHRTRGRTLSELANKLLVKRKQTLTAAAFDQWLQDVDIFKRCAEHTGACQGITEVRVALIPAKPA